MSDAMDSKIDLHISYCDVCKVTIRKGEAGVHLETDDHSRHLNEGDVLPVSTDAENKINVQKNKDKGNFYRFSQILIDVGTVVLKQLFKDYNPALDVKEYITKLSKSAFGRLGLTEKEKELLCLTSASMTPDIDTFDIALLSKLLLNLSFTIDDQNVRKLRDYRNNDYAHTTAAKMDSLEYKSKVADVRSTLNALAEKSKDQQFAKKIENTIEDILNQPTPADLDEKVQTIQTRLLYIERVDIAYVAVERFVGNVYYIDCPQCEEWHNGLHNDHDTCQECKTHHRERHPRVTCQECKHYHFQNHVHCFSCKPFHDKYHDECRRCTSYHSNNHIACYSCEEYHEKNHIDCLQCNVFHNRSHDKCRECTEYHRRNHLRCAMCHALYNRDCTLL